MGIIIALHIYFISQRKVQKTHSEIWSLEECVSE